jgi:PIN domain nuclease of toxin-antitoxin system
VILLDTNIWLRWLLPTNPLPNSLISKIERANTIFISSMSCWEVVMLEQRQRIELPLPTEEWLKEATTGSNIEILPITCDISYLAGTLPEHHKDPVDRIIIATVVCHDLKLMSLDSVFPLYPILENRLITK